MDPIAKQFKALDICFSFSCKIIWQYDSKNDPKYEKDRFELLACTKKMSWGPSFNKPKVPKIVHLRSIPKNEYLRIFLVF